MLRPAGFADLCRHRGAARWLFVDAVQQEVSMTKKPPLVTSILFLFAVALIPGHAQSQLVSEMWQITPKAGMEAGFQEAFKAHIEFREAQGDPWVWQTWEIVVGEDVGDFLVVSWDHAWADFDAYENSDFVGIAGPHFGATVAPLVDDAVNMISQADTTMQKLPTDPDYEVNLVMVMSFDLLPGKFMAFEQGMAQLNEAMQEMPGYFTSSAPVVGGDGSDFTLAFLGENWADFAEEEPSFMEVMMEMYGEEEAMAIWTSLDECIASVSSRMVRLRPDLSSPPEM
jgi:hypothetical protein